ncbi:MAG: AI-2E family transporter [Chloroflexota bacterium]
MEAWFKRNQSIFSYSFFILISAVTLWLMFYAQAIIIPIVISICICYIINGISDQIRKVKFGKYQIPNRVALLITLILIIVGILLIARMFAQTVLSVAQDLPKIEQNINQLLVNIPERFLDLVNNTLGITLTREISSIFNSIFTVVEDSIFSRVSNFATQIAYFSTQTFIVVIYVIFISLEQGQFRRKLHFMYPNSQRHDEIEQIFKSINEQIQAYISVKTWVSFITGLASFIVMYFFDLDNALFWAILIFLLNYIPYVGSIVAVAFPVLFSLAQFGSWFVFLGLLGLLLVVQIIVGYFLEPMIMGDNLGISPFVVLVSLTIFNTIWGITGMLLAIPLVIIIIITLSHFNTTRPIAILLSNDGRVYGVDVTQSPVQVGIEGLHAAD